MTNKQALRLAAKNATRGDWKFARSGFNTVVQSPAVLQRGRNSLVVICKLFRSEWRGELQTSLDAAFIAAANPATVLALLDELEESERLRVKFQDANCELCQKLEAAEKRIDELTEFLAHIKKCLVRNGEYAPLSHEEIDTLLGIRAAGIITKVGE